MSSARMKYFFLLGVENSLVSIVHREAWVGG
jgi:hypothetical protein